MMHVASYKKAWISSYMIEKILDTSNYPFVSIIILNYNGLKYLNNLFESLSKIDYPRDKYEIIMGDNASEDNSVDFVKKKFPFVKILQFDANYGFCKGNNLCLNSTAGEFLVFLNTDTVVTTDWLKNLVISIQSDEKVVVVGSKLLKPYKINGHEVVDYAGGKITYEINFYEGYGEFDSPNYSIRKYTGFACGASLIVDKRFFLKIGCFDEYYFGGGEEVELGMRAWQYGYKVLYEPTSIVYHLRYGTFKSTDPYPTYAWVKSMFYFIWTNFERKNIIIYSLEAVFLTQIPKIIVFAFSKKLSMLKSIIKGMVDFLVELKRDKLLYKIYEKRIKIKSDLKMQDRDLFLLNITTTFRTRLLYRLKTYRNWKNYQK